jgi:hypothetical protein
MDTLGGRRRSRRRQSKRASRKSRSRSRSRSRSAKRGAGPCCGGATGADLHNDLKIHCMKCKTKRKGEQASKRQVVKKMIKGNPRYFLFDICEVCGTKMSRILGKNP